MGKNLIQQRRGRGSPTYRAPSFRYAGQAKHPKLQQDGAQGKIMDFVRSQGHSAPLMVIKFETEDVLTVAPEGVRIGDLVGFGKGSELSLGSVLSLGDIPEGTLVCNVEGKPGDGGRYSRTSGSFARVVSKTGSKVILRLPSKKEKEFDGRCKATVGIAAGGGRLEKPLVKAGKMYHKMKAKNKLWPSVSGTSMNAVDHPFGSKGSHTKGRPTQSARNSPPGRKVGKIAPRRTGRRTK